MATLARLLDPDRLTNLVVPWPARRSGSQLVVFLGEEAARIFLDLRPDAVIGGT